MKKSRATKPKKTAEGSTDQPSLAEPSQATLPVVNAAWAAKPSVAVLEFPPPHYLLERARGETNRKLLQDYLEVIQTLRDEKGFSFREIAEWLSKNGVDADYNAVYRAYTKYLSDTEVAQLDQEEADEDR